MLLLNLVGASSKRIFEPLDLGVTASDGAIFLANCLIFVLDSPSQLFGEVREVLDELVVADNGRQVVFTLHILVLEFFLKALRFQSEVLQVVLCLCEQLISLFSEDLKLQNFLEVVVGLGSVIFTHHIVLIDDLVEPGLNSVELLLQLLNKLLFRD